MNTYGNFLKVTHAKGISDNSRSVKKGDIFVAIKGEHVDGNAFVNDAIAKGAAGIVSEIDAPDTLGVEYLKVENAREALSLLAAEFYGNPVDKLKVIGVTGSDGKTTTAHMIYEILKKAGKKVGLISTISAKIGNKEVDTGFHVTNPEPLLLQKILAEMVKEKMEYVVLEVTSHGIDQKRIAGIDFDTAVLTNITHEHLDYHKTFENYRDTKLKLFLKAKTSILNKDDNSYEYFDNKIKGEKITYSAVNKTRLYENIPGRFNTQNALAATAVAKKLKIPESVIEAALQSMKLPKGRLEKIPNLKGIDLYIDFASTPNSLKEVLTFLRSKTKANLIVVFGCAGERDIQKRPMMAGIATNLADISVFTAEDPRSENVEDIIKQMEEGVVSDSEYYKIQERGEAISFAINKLAKKRDTVVVTGKAHETSMAYNGIEYPWSDFKAVEYALAGKVLKISRA